MIDPTAEQPVYAMLAGGLALGFVNSLHCVGMCGPLIAAAHAGGGLAGTVASGLGYHGARVGAYGAVGGVAGAVGGALGVESIRPGGAAFAFVLAAVMVVMAFGYGEQLGRLGKAGGVVSRVFGHLRELSPGARGAAIGLLAPLLPCGLLYAAVAVSLAAASASAGAAAMVGFALGAVPALALAQWKLGWIRARLGIAAARWVARGLMLVAAGLLVWRGALELSGTGSCCGGHA